MKPIAATLFALLLLPGAAFAQTHMHEHQAAMSHSAMDHDRMFADGMSQHHRDGIEMARLAVDKAANAELRAMAQKMIDDQTREIDEMQRLRGDGPATPMDAMMKMPGMMPKPEMERDMARLRSATGQEFDSAFTEIMPKHHQGAITMAKHYLDRGSNEGLKTIARGIIDKQSRERQQLLAMHDGMQHSMTSSSSAEETPRQRMRKD